MNRRIVFAAFLVAAIAGGGIWWIARENDGNTYAGLRQTSVQDIPGALGFALEPPPADYDPVLTPRQAMARYPAEGGDVSISLASIRDTFEDRLYGPAWVLFARGVCLRNAKGELVSDARGNDPNNLACTDATVWILAVEPSSGEPLVALTAYDETGTFGPTTVVG